MLLETETANLSREYFIQMTDVNAILFFGLNLIYFRSVVLAQHILF